MRTIVFIIGNGINQFTFWGELVFSLPKSANNPFSKGLAF